MEKLLASWQTLRSFLFAFRVIAFEKPAATLAVGWFVLSLPAAAVAFSLSVETGLGALLAAGLLFVPLSRRASAFRERLIRPGDRIEFARYDEADDSYRQRFGVGVVLQRLSEDAARRSGRLDGIMTEGSRRFFLVQSGKEVLLIPSAWIVGIEIDDTIEKG